MKNKVFITIGIFIACFLIATGNSYAQKTTSVTVTDIGNVALAKKMEQEASKLLTSFNDAFVNNRQPALTKAQAGISDIWAITPLRCIEEEIIERGYTTNNGYQIRNIPMFLNGVPEEDAERDIAINFDRNGNITDIYFMVSIGGFLSEAKEVTDLRRRLELVDFVEKFRTAYNRKDIATISKSFSEDAQIITGRVTRVVIEGVSKEVIEYRSQTKKEYIDNLKDRVFVNNKVIDVRFNDIEIRQHPKYDHIYGVNFKQDWNSTTYNDFGYVFLYIDFRDKEPIIKVRTWQPEQFGGRTPNIDDLFEKFL